MQESTKKIEALLFVAGEPVPKKDLAALADVHETELANLLLELDESLVGHGLTIIMTDTHVEIVTDPSVTPFLSQFLQVQEPALSRAGTETLAIVAYRGPIQRSDVEAIRGVDCRQTLRQLTYRGFIAAQTNGKKTITYDITPDFFHYLGITKREDLPNFTLLAHHERIIDLLKKQSPTL